MKMRRNKQADLIEALEWTPLLSETELIGQTWGYWRGVSPGSNKKYADIVRRAVKSGLIARTEIHIKGERNYIWYYQPDPGYIHG